MLAVPKAMTNKLFGARADEIRERFSQGADITAFQDLPFILLKRGNRMRGIVDQYFSRRFFKPKIALETENTITTLAMAQSSMGVTICPELFLRAIQLKPAQASGQLLDLFPLNDPPQCRLVTGCRRDRYLAHFAERFVELTRDALAEEPWERSKALLAGQETFPL